MLLLLAVGCGFVATSNAVGGGGAADMCALCVDGGALWLSANWHSG